MADSVLGDDISKYNLADFQLLKCARLREILKGVDEPTSGNKSALVARVWAQFDRRRVTLQSDVRPTPIDNVKPGNEDDVTYHDLLLTAVGSLGNGYSPDPNSGSPDPKM
jgi:hypothetical protein